MEIFSLWVNYWLILCSLVVLWLSMSKLCFPRTQSQHCSIKPTRLYRWLTKLLRWAVAWRPLEVKRVYSNSMPRWKPNCRNCLNSVISLWNKSLSGTCTSRTFEQKIDDNLKFCFRNCLICVSYRCAVPDIEFTTITGTSPWTWLVSFVYLPQQWPEPLLPKTRQIIMKSFHTLNNRLWCKFHLETTENRQHFFRDRWSSLSSNDLST